MATGDDAGVYQLRDDLAIVNTVDFFTPVVDDPFTFGQIAAANALSDIYAMGGIPQTALNILCWPQTGLPLEMLEQILRGGSEKAGEAGVFVIGGHSVADEEVKYGMAVTGVIDPQRIIRNVGARVGDALLLSKPLGTGILMTAFKRDQLAVDYYTAAVRWMTQLNAIAAQAMLKYEVHAATDITGFGLAGHGAKMADASDVSFIIDESDLPLLPGALELAKEHVPGGGKRNREFFGPAVRISEEVADEIATILFDPQTSGGLLISLAEKDALALLADLQNSGNTEAAIVGRVVPRERYSIELI